MAKSRLPQDTAVRRAEALVAELGINTLPVRPVDIAKKKGIEVKAGAVPGFSGCLMKVGDHFGIVYSTDLGNDGFVNFTVAHELGHYFLPGHPELLFPNGDGTHCSVGGFMSSEPHEREADAFAVGLLMPRSLFVPAMRECDPGFPAVEALAKACGTSLTATAIRYAEFAEDPVAVIVTSGGRVEFCVLGQAIKELHGLTWPKRGDLIPPRAVTAAINKNAAAIRACERQGGYSSLDDWVDGAPEIEVCEDAVGLGRYGKVLTVLFTDEAIEEPEDDDDDD